MMNRRTFLKLSAGALVLAAAGGLTGCGETPVDLNHPKQEVDGVVFLCDAVTNDASGGSKFKVRYMPYFAIWNKNDTPITIPRQNITGTFTDADGSVPMVFTEKDLNLSAKQYVEYNGATFCLETENSVESSWKDGTYELHILYNNKTIVFRYDGEKMTTSIQ